MIARSSSALQPTAANSPLEESSLTLSGFQTPAALPACPCTAASAGSARVDAPSVASPSIYP